MSLSEDEEKTSASGEFIIDYGHRSLTGQKGKGGVDEWLKKYHKFTYMYLQFYAIDIDLISSNYSMYGLVVGMYGSVMKYYIVVLEKRDLEIILILF